MSWFALRIILTGGESFARAHGGRGSSSGTRGLTVPADWLGLDRVQGVDSTMHTK